MSLFSLIFRLGTDNRDFNRGMRDAERTANRTATQIDDAFSGVGKNVIRGGLATAALAFAAQQTRQAIVYADKLQDVSEQLSVSVTTLQELDYVAGQTGTTLEGFTGTFRKLAQARREALEDPTGKEAAAFQRLGVSIEQLRSSRLEDLLNLISVEFQRAGDSQLFFADSLLLLGRSAQETFGAMKGGLAELRQQAHEAGAVVSEETIARVARYADEWTLFGQKVRAAFTGVAGIIATVHQGGAAAIDAMIDGFKDLGNLHLFGGHMNLAEFNQFIGDKADANTFRKRGGFFGENHVPGSGGTREIGAEKRRREQNEAEEVFKVDDEAASALFWHEKAAEEKAAQKSVERAEVLRRMRLRPEDLVADLEKRLNQKREKLGLDVPDARDQLELTEMEIELEQARRGLPKKQAVERIDPINSDSLVAAGNFLGGAPDRRMEMELRRSNDTLLRIQQLLERQGNSGVRFD